MPRKDKPVRTVRRATRQAAQQQLLRRANKTPRIAEAVKQHTVSVYFPSQDSPPKLEFWYGS